MLKTGIKAICLSLDLSLRLRRYLLLPSFVGDSEVNYK